jgi:peptide/nickel transport system ATP-binding protein
MRKNDLADNSCFLSVNNLTVEYTSEGEVIHAVNDVSLRLNAGRTLGLVGETGAGKTTIAKSILRILPERSSRVINGEVFLGDEDIFKYSELQMREIRGRRISMIFQDPMTALDPVQNIGKQIAEVIKQHNDVSNKEAADRSLRMLEMVGIPTGRAGEFPHQFSGGMKQRVVIAIALACEPELLLADEPTTALDVTIQAQVLSMIDRLKRELNTSMILITHDLGVVAGTCDDVDVIYAGEIVESGSKEDIFDRPMHPYTRGLFMALPDLNSRTRRLTPIKGLPPDPTRLSSGCKFHPRCPYADESCRFDLVFMTKISETHFCRCQKIREQENVRNA